MANLGDVYEIGNPSDPYTLRAPSDLVAGLAVMFVGEGRYPCKDAAGETVLPFMMLGGDPNAWVREHSDYAGIDAAMKVVKADVAAALRSVLIGSFDERGLFEAAVAKMPEAERVTFAAEWHEKKRTSLNDIGGYAAELAVALVPVSAAEGL